MGSNAKNALQAAAPTHTPRAIGCGAFAPSVPAQARLDRVQHNGRQPQHHVVAAPVRPPTLHSSARRHSFLDAGPACVPFHLRSLACRCPRRRRSSYHLALGASIAPAAPSLSPSPAFTRSQFAHHALPATPLLFTPRPPPGQIQPSSSPDCGPIVGCHLRWPCVLRIPTTSIIGCRSSAVGSPSLAPQTRCASNSLPSCQKAPTRHSFALPVSGEQQDCLHPRKLALSRPRSLNPTPLRSPASGQCRYSSSRHSLRNSWTEVAR
jgi:hypothetical protein